MEPHIYGVTEVNQLVKGLLDSAPALQGVAVRGELSNYKIHPSGHHYFTLKDQEGALRCVMFQGQASRPPVPSGERHEGRGLRPHHRVPPGPGPISSTATPPDPGGGGDLAVAFQQLKRKAVEGGPFDPAQKKSPCRPIRRKSPSSPPAPGRRSTT